MGDTNEDGPPPGCPCELCSMNLVFSSKPAWRIFNSCINELERLKAMNADLRRRVQRQKAELPSLPDATEDGDTAEIPASQSTAAAPGGGEGRPPGFTSENMARIRRLAMERLEENHSAVDEELFTLLDVLEKVAKGLSKVVRTLSRAGEELKEWEGHREPAA